MSAWRQQPSPGSGRWLSREFAELLADSQKCRTELKGIEAAYDVIIVGSGYGGAIAAAELAGSGLSVCVLERGREYLPGAFPSQLSELPAHIRGSFAGRKRGGEGLFDLRVGSDVSVVLANGLGGGSLINAGVMEIPQDRAFGDAWPGIWRNARHRRKYYNAAKLLLGSARRKQGRKGLQDECIEDNRISDHAEHRSDLPKKTQVLKKMAPAGTFRKTAITVAMQDKTTVGGVQLKACKLCGDCATGCNYGAKESLDTNLLAVACRLGAEIYCGATALRVQRPQGRSDLWGVLVTHTDEKLRQREGAPRWIAARKLILAAGSLGSTEILQRSQRAAPELWFSALLGQRFSTNGDMIAFGYDYGATGEANAVADEDELPAQRQVGPTITGVIRSEARSKDRKSTHSIVIEELAVPGALRRLAGESIATADTLHSLGEFDCGRHAGEHPADDPFAVHPRKLKNLSIFAAMGDDGAAGSLRLDAAGEGDAGDGHVGIVWPGVGKLPLFDAQIGHLSKLAERAGFGGRTIANPMWRLLPKAMDFLIGDDRGPLLTVHPLGGCPMGDSVEQGVVDACGRVFDPMAGAQGLHEGLVVLDGAIVPGALGTNPALTIAAVSLRAARRLRRDWAPGKPTMLKAKNQPRPQIADIEAEIAARPPRHKNGTVAGVTERLSGPLWLRDARGKPQRCHVEITLTYDPLRLDRLFVPDSEGRLSGATLTAGKTPQSKGQLRIFRQQDWDALDAEGLSDTDRCERERVLARHYELSGSLTILRREASCAATRIRRGGLAWVRNRGLRDSYLGAREWLSGAGQGGGPSILSRGWGMLKLASRAGEVRRFDYELRIGRELTERMAGNPAAPLELPALEGKAIRGGKRITYSRLGNPWRQLMELQLDELAGLLLQGKPRLLTLEPRYLAASGQPLLRIERQRDHIGALADFASLGGYFLRMMLSIHVLSARKPDRARDRPVQRLPGRVPGLPEPEIHTIEVDRIGERPVLMQLTRYRASETPAGRPVLLIHGYSASGTTFAHPALKPGLAPYLAERGRDVWVADLRSSAGMPTATHPWTFECVALSDIPAAIDHIWWRSGEQQVDVVAHCMGAVMLSMAVLSSDKTPREIDELLCPRDGAEAARPVDRFRAERKALPQRIGRVVLSQNGPVMVMSQQNIFRAYVMSYLEQLFGPLTYRFRSLPDEGLPGELLDRFLGTLPYPDEDIAIENPWRFWRRTEFVASRHRMDALYGRTFSLRNLSDEVLEHIDDFFGPLSLDTVGQVIHFARLQVITNRNGYNRFVSSESLEKLWPFQTLSMHGEENGLADIATLARLKQTAAPFGTRFRRWTLEGFGHQDSLIGKRSRKIFRGIHAFISQPPAAVVVPPPKPVYFAECPWLGPMLNLGADGITRISLGASPQLGRPAALCCWPVTAQGRDQLAQAGIAQERTLQMLARDADSDWLTVALPDWVPAWTGGSGLRHLALLLLYPQPDCIADPGFDTGAARDAWMLERQPDFAAGDDDTKRQVAAMIEAVRLALGAAGPDGASRLKPGVVSLLPPQATEMPLPASSSLRLVLGSCQYPAGILNELPAHESWQRLNRRLDRGDAPDLMVLTGDQIYADATGGMFDPTLAGDRYRKPCESWLHNREVRNALRRLPLLTMLDDHEIDDNWEPVAGGKGDADFELNERRREQGVAMFRRFQRAGEDTGSPLHYGVAMHGIPIFLLDSRTQRQRRTAADAAIADLFGDVQWQALTTWLLAAPRDRPKLIVAPVLLLPRHRWSAPALLVDGKQDLGEGAALGSDGFDGFPHSLYGLLEFVAANDIHGLVFLSGDEHLGLCTTARIHGAGGDVTIHSIHTPGLNTPYRFANAREADFVPDETIRLTRETDDGTVTLDCEVKTRFFEGPGFTDVTLLRTGGGWRLHCTFDTPEATAASQREWSAMLL